MNNKRLEKKITKLSTKQIKLDDKIFNLQSELIKNYLSDKGLDDE